jgi:hypothetical protein
VGAASDSGIALGSYDSSPWDNWIQSQQDTGVVSDLVLQPRGANVGIGTTAPSDVLHTYTNKANGFAAKFVNDGNNANRNVMSLIGGADDASGTTYYIQAFDGDGGGVGRIENASGTFQLVDESDSRFKENIAATVLTGLETINAVDVIDFDRKKNGIRVVGGFTAQQLLDVFPAAVSGAEDDVDADGNIEPMAVAKEKFVPLLVKAMQELSAKVTALEAA